MSAVASSRINKSGKKFAPRAPVRRSGAPPSRSARPEAAVNQEAEAPSDVQPQPSTPPEATSPLSTIPKSVSDAKTTATAESDRLPDTTTSIQPPDDGSTAIPVPQPLLVPAPSTSSSTTPHGRPSEPVSITVPATIPASPLLETDNTSTRPVKQSLAKPLTEKRKRSEPSRAQQSKVSARKRQKIQSGNEEGPTHSEAGVLPGDSTQTRSSPQSRRLRRGRTPAQDVQHVVADTEGPDGPVATKKRRLRKPPQKVSMERVAADVVANATEESTEPAKRGRKRLVTPEEAESHEIDTTAVAMGDLTRDTRLGKKSEREVRLQNTDWDEVKRKRKLLEEARLAGPPTDPTPSNNQPNVPQFKEVNGQIVMVEGSELVSIGGLLDEEATAPAAINEDDIVNRVNSGTLGRKKNHIGRNHWDEEMTQRFYRGLRMFGTDFMMISHIFPGLSRRHIKSKFVKEERARPDLIRQALLGPREAVDLCELSELNNTTYRDVSEFQKELDAVQEEQEAAYAKQKAEEAKQVEAAAAAAAAASGSTANGTNGHVGDRDLLASNPSAGDNRFSTIADEIVNATTSTGAGHFGKRGAGGRGKRGGGTGSGGAGRDAAGSGGKGPRVEGGEARILGPIM